MVHCRTFNLTNGTKELQQLIVVLVRPTPFTRAVPTVPAYMLYMKLRNTTMSANRCLGTTQEVLRTVLPCQTCGARALLCIISLNCFFAQSWDSISCCSSSELSLIGLDNEHWCSYLPRALGLRGGLKASGSALVSPQARPPCGPAGRHLDAPDFLSSASRLLFRFSARAAAGLRAAAAVYGAWWLAASQWLGGWKVSRPAGWARGR